MANKQYRLERLKQGAKIKQAEASTKSSEAKIADAKARLAEYKSKKNESRAVSNLAQRIREQEARKKKEGSTFKKVSGAVKFSPQLSKSLLSYGSGYTQNTARSQAGPGRPRAVYKWRSPFTGKPITAPQYYKEVRAYRRIQEQTAEQNQAQQLRELAKRGINPQQAAVIQLRNQQMQQAQNIEQMRRPQVQPQVNQLPEQLPNIQPSSAVRPIWRRSGQIVEDWGLFGKRRIVVGNHPQSFWN